MSRLLKPLAVLLLLLGSHALADRADTWLASTVVVTNVHLQLLDDGGCSIVADGKYAKSDGGSFSESSTSTQLSGANRTSCLDILTTKAPVLFKADRGL